LDIGASLVIEDANGPIKLTEPTYLQGDGASATVTKGKFKAVASFTLADQ